MRQNSLSEKGLTISEAQSISNVLNQKALDIKALLDNVNSAAKTVTIDGKEYITVKGNSLPDNIIDLLKQKASYHACQAFLMENIKAKEALLNEAYNEKTDINSIEVPDSPMKEYPHLLFEVKEEWGWDQLTSSELEEYYEAEAYASHIGQFIHNKGKLDTLRKEIPNLPSIEWLEVETGKKTPVTIIPTHDLEYLSSLHVDLSQLHKQYENKVNYFKAKVKNLVTLKNNEIAEYNNKEVNKINSINDLANKSYQEEVRKYTALVDQVNAEFETKRAEKIKKIVNLRITIPSRFQQVINEVISK